MTTEQFAVGDRTAIVTGASSGIGRTIAERFADGGADVVVCSHSFQQNPSRVEAG